MTSTSDLEFSSSERRYWAGRSVLVTGATGFIGANLVRQLLPLQARVHVLARPTSSTWRLDDCRQDLVIHRGDLCNYPDLTCLFNRVCPDICFHLATERGTQTSGRIGYVQTSILGAAHLLELLRQRPDCRLVVSGSSTEYAPASGPIPETHPLQPVTLHGAVKASASLLYQQAALAQQLAISQLRLFHVYGPWESSHRFLPQAIQLARAGQPIPLVAGLSRRDWVHVDDVVRALLVAAFPEAPAGIYNIGSGVEFTNDQVLDALESVLGYPLTRWVDAMDRRPTDSEHRYADIALARERLGWRPRFTLADGIRHTLTWLELNPAAWVREEGDAPVVH